MLTQAPQGRGESLKLAQFLNVKPSLVSTILNTDRHFSIEQIYDLSEYLNLNEIETDYFISLATIEKAGTVKLKEYWTNQRNKIAENAKKLKTRMHFENELTEEQKLTYLSDPIYSFIRVLSTLKHGVDLDLINHLSGRSVEDIQKALNFLINNNLIKKKNNKLFSSEKLIYFDRESPHFLRHHLNWRVNQLVRMSNLNNFDLNLNFPCTLDKESFEKSREILVTAFKQIVELVKDAEPNEMAVLTIDFISYYK